MPKRHKCIDQLLQSELLKLELLKSEFLKWELLSAVAVGLASAIQGLSAVAAGLVTGHDRQPREEEGDPDTLFSFHSDSCQSSNPLSNVASGN